MKYEKVVQANPFDQEVLYKAKRMGFADKTIAKYWNVKELEVYNFTKRTWHRSSI